LPGLAHLVQLLADILLNGSGILMQGFQDFLGKDVAVLLQNQNSGALKGILGMTDKQSRSTSKRAWVSDDFSKFLGNHKGGQASNECLSRLGLILLSF
jgi:hypothetical protein